MSYDLMVFKGEAAPKVRKDFMEWFAIQAEWSEGHSYDDPANTSPELRNWFMEMIKTFPAMNGPFANNDDDDDDYLISDYCIGRDVIYVAFAWSVAEQAYDKMVELAKKHGVGFFDVSNDDGDILFPENGELKGVDEGPGKNIVIPDVIKEVWAHNKKQKPWWKFW
jgi:hypothetical protein